MAKSNITAPDVKIIVAIDGGNSITEGSGGAMYKDVEHIFKSIEDNITTKINVQADPKSLKKIGKQIVETVETAIKTIENLPIHFALTPDEQSISKAVKAYKDELKKQSIDLTINPKNDNKPSRKNKKAASDSDDISASNIKKGAKDASNEIKEVQKDVEDTTEKVNTLINDMTAKLNKMSSELSSETLGKYTSELTKIASENKRAFSIEEINVFREALDLSSDANSLISVIEIFKAIQNEAKETAVVAEEVKQTLRDVAPKNAVKYSYDSRDVLEEFLKTRKGSAATKEGYEFTRKAFESFINSYKSDGSERGNAIARIIQWNKTRDRGIFKDDILQGLDKYYGNLIAEVKKSDGTIKYRVSSLSKLEKSLQEKEQKVAEENSLIYNQAINNIENGFKTNNAESISSNNIKQTDNTTAFIKTTGQGVKELNEELSQTREVVQLVFEDFENSLSGVTEAEQKATQAAEDFKDAQDVSGISNAIEQVGDISENTIVDIENLDDKIQDLGSQPVLNSLDKEIEEISEDTKGLDNVADAIEHIGDNAEEAAIKSDKLNKTTISQINKLNADFYGYEDLDVSKRTNYNNVRRLQDAINSSDPNAYLQVSDLGVNNFEQAVERINELIPMAQREARELKLRIRETGKEASEAKKKAEKAAEQEQKAFEKLDETLAKADSRIIVLKNDLNNINTSQRDIGNKQTSLGNEISEIEKLEQAIKDYSLLTDSADRETFEWAEHGAKGVNSLREAVEKLNSLLSTTEANMKSANNFSSYVTDSAAASIVSRYNSAVNTFRNTEGHEKYSDLLSLNPENINTIDKTKERMQALTEETKRLTNATRELNTQHRDEEGIITQRNKIYQEADNYYKKYQSGIKANVTLNKQWLELLEKINTGGFGKDNESARRALASLQTATKEANAETMTLWDSLKKLFTDHFGAVSATAFIGTLRNVMRGAYQNVLEIDKAMTELKKVTELTEKQYESFMNTASEMATKVGGTIADTINSTADFARLGFNIKDASSLAEAALIYKNVGDGLSDINEASESIISTIKAFSDVDANDALSIIDKFNEVGNNYAISSSGIGTALQKSAAALASANNTLDESIALITAANSVVQNPEIVGTTAKTISMFLRASKTEAEEAGIETEGMAESVSKLRDEILSLSNVDIMADSENYKSTYQVLKEISKVWDHISDVSQANILEKLGGKRNANVVASIIENFDVAEQALRTSLESAGSATKENEKYLDSIEGHINKLKVAYEDLSQTVIESDLIKGGADFLTNLLGGLNDVTNFFGTFPTLVGTATAALSAFKDVGLFRKSDLQLLFNTGSINSLGSRFSQNLISGKMNSRLHFLVNKFNQLNEAGELTGNTLEKFYRVASRVGGSPLANTFADIARQGQDAKASIEDCYSVIIRGNTKGIGNVSNIIATYNSLQSNSDRTSFRSQLATTNQELAEFLNNVGDGQAAITGYIKQQAKAKASSIGLTLATTALNTAISLTASLLVQGVISLASYAIDDITNGVSNATERLNEHIDSVKSLETEIKSIQEEAKKYRDRIIELQNISVPTLFEQDELNTLKEENAELERNLKLKQAELEVEKYNKSKEAKRASVILTEGSEVERVLNQLNYFLTFLPGLNALGSKSIFDLDKSQYDKDLDILSEYERTIKNIKYWEESYASGNTSEKVYNEMMSQNEARLKELQATLSSERATIELYLSQLSQEDLEDPKNAEFINKFQEFIKSYDALYNDINGLNISKFTELYESIEFANVTNQLDKLAKEGRLTEDVFNHVEGIEKFKEALESIGITDIQEVIRAIIKRVNESADVAESAADKYNYLTSNINKLKETVNSTLSNHSTLQSAFDKIQEGTSLTADEVMKLVDICSEDFPEINSLFEKTADGYTISANDIIRANEAIVNSTKESLQKTIDDYRSIRNEYEQYSSKVDTVDTISGMPESVKNKLKSDYDIGITTDKYEDAGNKISELELILSMLDETLSKNSEDISNYNDILKEFSSNVSSGAAAQKEMQENGRISISTYESLISLGDEYWKTITVENGAIKFSIDAFKDLTKAKLEDELATAGLALAEAKLQATYEASHSEYNYAISERTKQLVDEAQQRFDALSTSSQNFEYTWEQALLGSQSDTTDSDYSKALDKLKRANTGTIEAEEEYIKKWRQLNEDTYKNTDAEKYEENLREIEDYIKGLNSLLDSYIEKWGKLNDYDENNISSRQTYLTELQRKNYDLYGNRNSTFFNLDTYEKNLADQAKYEADTLKMSFDRGLTSYEDYMSGIRDIREKYKDRDGNYLLDMSFVSGYEDVDKYYDEQLEALQKANDKSLDAERQYISDWNALNDKLYKGVDVNKYESNRKSIAESELKLLERMYTEGYITAKEYFDKVTALWNENSDILGKDTQYDWLEEAWNKRTADEKLYWEQQKELATQYYNEEIKKLQEVKDEEEKVAKAEELRLNLIKARQKLEEAKSQKNQLVFHDGTFEYMADQEAIMSAEEEVANALKEIKDNELQEQIKVLEDQRDEALLFYSNIIGMLDNYINGTRQIESSDPEVIEEAMASESGNYFMRLMRGEITMDEVRDELRKQFTKDETATTTADSTVTDSRDKADVQNDNTINEITKVGGEVAGIVNSFAGLVDNMKSLDIGGLLNLAVSLMGKVSKDDTIGFVGTSTSEAISNAINNVYNNSNVSNDNSVNVGDIHMTIQGGTSQEMLDQFANQLSSAIITAVPRALV